LTGCSRLRAGLGGSAHRATSAEAAYRSSGHCCGARAAVRARRPPRRPSGGGACTAWLEGPSKCLGPSRMGKLTGIDPGEIAPLLDALMAEDWVVYAKPCLDYTESVISNLARYTHRIAIRNAPILGLEGDQVHLRYRDYLDGEHKTLVLAVGELVRRFVLHILPQGLMRVRHDGLLANRGRVQRLAQIRLLLSAPAPEPTPEADAGEEREPGWPCPACRRGRMRPARRIAPPAVSLGRLLPCARAPDC
jgi:hypothetical protein